MFKLSFLLNRRALLSGAAMVCGAFVASQQASAIILEFDTELTSLNLSGGPVGLPLASDPGNALGDSINGYGFVGSQVSISLSSQRSVNPGMASKGKAMAFDSSSGIAGSFEDGPGMEPVDPNLLHGERFFVNSFFDVFFDVTVTDVDARPGRDYIGGMPSLMLQDIGPANMQSFYGAVFDKDAPNYGLIPPPESAPYIGHFLIEIPLGVDINGNGENDKLKFTLATHAAGDANRTFIILPDGTVIDTFDSFASLEGAIVDESSDPPFTIQLSGPTTASSFLNNPVINSGVPEPSEVTLLAVGAVAMFYFIGRQRKQRATA